MELIHYALIALILFLLHKIMETNYYLSRLNLEVKNVQLESHKERSRTLQELKNATKITEQVLKQLKNSENDKRDTVGSGKNQAEKPTKVVNHSIGPHNNDNTFINVNFNLNLVPPFADIGFQSFGSNGPFKQLPAFPLRALKY